MAKSFRVPEELHRAALDAIVRSAESLSWGRARTLIERGKVAVDGDVITEITKRIGKGSDITITENAPDPRKAKNTLALDDAIAFQDAHVIVVRKPAGVSSVPFDEKETGTLDELVRAYLGKRERGNVRPAVGVVHRLDKDTTGLIVFTRSWLAKQSLSSQFRFHTVHRKYIAIVHGTMSSTTLRSHIVADRGDGRRGSTERHGQKGNEEGQLAVTHIRAIERLGDDATLIECELETGRTHQIRIHLSEVGHPLVGERVYNKGFQGTELPAPRIMLHAAELGFVHPKTEREVRFEEPLPRDMLQRIDELRRRDS